MISHVPQLRGGEVAKTEIPSVDVTADPQRHRPPKRDLGPPPPILPGTSGVIAGLSDVPRGRDDIHIVFSTDCSPYQDYQSYTLFHSARTVGHFGRITRLASGCSAEERGRLSELHRKLPNGHAVHFTPDYSIDQRTGERYPYYNKPFAMQHFMRYASPPVNETIVALVDPDMIFLVPLTPFVGPGEIVFSTGHPNDKVRGPYTYWVTKGHPVAQAYEYGGRWSVWPDLKEIVPEGSAALNLQVLEAARYYAVGPPYLVHAQDWIPLADMWTKLVAGVVERHPSILSEMIAFSLGAAHLLVPFSAVNSYMVSDPRGGPAAEAWDLVEGIPPRETCRSPKQLLDTGRRLPTTLHYCQMYRSGVYMFGKRREVLRTIFRCGGPLLADPPANLALMKTRVHPGPRSEPMSQKTASRNAFAICVATKAINDAVLDYKERFCEKGAKDGANVPRLRLTDLSSTLLADTRRWKKEGAM